MPSVYATVFGGSPIAPAIPTYLTLTFSVNTVLGWPLESNITSPAVAAWIDASATAAALTLQLSDARQVSTGYTAIFNNVGANTFTVLDAQGNTLFAPISGASWILVLADNSTLQGTWRFLQLGAGVSVASAAALAGNGLKAITTTLNERIFINAQAVNYTILITDRAACVEWTGGSGGVFTAPVPATVGADWFCYIKNSGTGVLTLSGTIDGSSGKSFQPNDSCILVSDGANLFTMGFGQSVASSFSFVTISLAGASGTVTLTGAQLNRISYRFTGALAGNTVVMVPATIQQYWVDNETTGAFTLTISAGAGTVTVAQGTRNILYCDGLNIVNAVSTGTGGTTLVADGSAAAPGLAWASDTQMGLYKVGTDTLGVSTAGTARISVNATGNVVVNASTSGVTFAISGLATQFATSISAPNTASQSKGLLITAGTNSSDDALLIQNAAGSTMVTVQGNGTVAVSAPASGNAVTIAGVAGTPALKLSPGAVLDPATDVVGLAAGSAVTRYNANNSSNTGIIGVSGAAGQWTPSSVAGDIVLRNTGAVRFSIDGGTTEKVVIGTTGGPTVTITDTAGVLQINSDHASGHGIRFNDTNASPQSFDIGLGVGPGTATLTIFDRTNSVTRLQLAGTGAFTINAPTGAAAFTVNGAANNNTLSVVGNNTAGQSFGLVVAAGTNSSDIAFLVNSRGGTSYFEVRGDGLVQAVDAGGTLQSVGWRGTPVNVQAGNYTLVLSDQGKTVELTGSSNTLTVPSGVFSAGDVVTILAFSGTNTFTIAQGAGMTLFWAGNGNTTGNRTLSSVGEATLLFQASGAAVIGGPGVS